MTTPDLVRQILAAFEATEQDARAAAKFGGAVWSVEPFTPSSPDALPAVVWVVDGAEDGMAMVNGDPRARHIARHDPASVLRRCAADRKLVELHAGPHECADDAYTNRTDPCAVVALLAEAYGVHLNPEPGSPMAEDLADDAAIERDLIEAQAAVVSAREAPRRRQEAVVRAREAKWSKYRIAAALGLNAGYVTAIITAARKEARKEAARREEEETLQLLASADGSPLARDLTEGLAQAQVGDTVPSEAVARDLAERAAATATVHKEEDWFIAQATTPDVASQGRTEEEARTNLREAVELYLTSRDTP